MRFTSIFALLLAFSLALVCQSYAKIDSATVVGLWLFDEGTGEVAEDSSGNGNDGTFGGGGAKWVNAKYGKGLEFGGDGWLECGKGESLDFKESTNFSIHSVVKANGAPTGKCIIWKGLGCSTWSQWLLGTGEHENSVTVANATFHFRASNGGDRLEARSADEIPTGERIQVAGTYDGAKLRVYVKGALAGETDTSATPWASPENVYIGADPGCGNRCQWVGTIYEIGIFDKTLSDAEIEDFADGIVTAVYLPNKPSFLE